MAHTEARMRLVNHIGRTIPICLILLSVSCSQREADSVIDYFWPLKEGHVFVYELQGGGKRIIEITTVRKESDGEIVVRVTSHFQDVGLPVPQEATVEIFKVVPKKNIIHRTSLLTKEQPKEFVHLKGPIEVGTKWSVPWISPGVWSSGDSEPMSARKSEPVKGTARCQISAIKSQLILEENPSCVTVSCRVSQKDVQVSHHQYHCKGIGYIGTQITGRIDGTEIQPEWLEKLVEIR